MFRSDLTYFILLSIGTHVGHSVRNSHIYTAWLAYTYIRPLDVIFINLFKSVIMARTGFIAIGSACTQHAPIWFVDLDPVNKHYAKYIADCCGEFSWMGKWVHGALSNFSTMVRLIHNFLPYSKLWLNARQKWFIGDLSYWIMTRMSWPRAVFTHSVHTSQPPVREAFFLGIPCFGVVDTNAYSNRVSMALPGNDDSITCIAFYNGIVNEFIMSRKIMRIINWYFHVRKNRELLFTNKDNAYTSSVRKVADLDFYAFEDFEIASFAETSFHYHGEDFETPNLQLGPFLTHLDKIYPHMRKFMVNRNVFDYYYRNWGKNRRIYSFNRYFTKRCWVKNYYKKLFRRNAHEIAFYSRKKRFVEGVEDYPFRDGFFSTWLNNALCLKLLQHKDIPSLSTNSSYYFSRLASGLGFDRPEKKIIPYVITYLNKWSRARLYGWELSHPDIKTCDKERFVISSALVWDQTILKDCLISFKKAIIFYSNNTGDGPFLHCSEFDHALIRAQLYYITRDEEVVTEVVSKTLIIIRSFDALRNKWVNKFYVLSSLLKLINNELGPICNRMKNYLHGVWDKNSFNLLSQRKFRLINRFAPKIFKHWKYLVGFKGWHFTRRRSWYRTWDPEYRSLFNNRKTRFHIAREILAKTLDDKLETFFEGAQRYVDLKSLIGETNFLNYIIHGRKFAGLKSSLKKHGADVDIVPSNILDVYSLILIIFYARISNNGRSDNDCILLTNKAQSSGILYSLVNRLTHLTCQGVGLQFYEKTSDPEYGERAWHIDHEIGVEDWKNREKKLFELTSAFIEEETREWWGDKT